MKVLKFLSLFVVLAVCSVAAAAQDKNTGTIKGKVKVERGSPSGVAVILLQGDREVRRVETDRKGEFALRGIKPGTYILRFRKSGLAVAAIDKLEVRSGTRSLKDLY